MGARVESLPIPVRQPSRKWSWILAGILALCLAAAASVVALRSWSNEASVPAQSTFAKSGPVQAITGTGHGLIEVANASANNTGHSLVYFTGAGSSVGSLANSSGHSLAYFTSGPGAQGLAAYANSGLITGTGPALAELSGGSSNVRSIDTCKRIGRGQIC